MEAKNVHLQGQCSALCSYVEKWAGGKRKAKWLEELQAWSKNVPSRTEVSAKQFELLSTACMTAYPEYITACMKALMVAPKSFVRKGEATIFDAKDIIDMSTSNKGKVQKAASIMQSCREWAAKAGFNEDAHPMLTLHLGLLDVYLVHHAHNKNCKERPKFDSLEDIGSYFVWRVFDCYHWPESSEKPQPPFEPKNITSTSSSGSQAAAAPLREVPSGAMLQELGFKVGDVVKQKATEDETELGAEASYTLQSFTEEGAVLKDRVFPGRASFPRCNTF